MAGTRRNFIKNAGFVMGGMAAVARASEGGRGLADLPGNGLVGGADWNKFCRKLDAARNIISEASAPHDGLDQAEGYRYLTRLMRGALWAYVEGADPDFPIFISTTELMVKLGADNPDNVYVSATVDGANDYRIYGTRGTISYLSVESKNIQYGSDGSMHQTGELDAAKMTKGPGGSVEIIASRTPKPGKNWLPMTEDTTTIIIRQSYLDRKSERPGTWHIERIGGPSHPKPLDPEGFSRALVQTADFVYGTARTFASWTRRFMTRPNELPDWGQKWYQQAGGDPALFYLHGYWKIAADEAWIIHTEIPQAPYWNFQLDNWWMESLDYRHFNVTLNKHTAKLNPDGTLTIVVAATDPGADNWIETAGHLQGTALLRWLHAKTHPIPKCKVVKLSQVHHYLKGWG